MLPGERSRLKKKYFKFSLVNKRKIRNAVLTALIGIAFSFIAPLIPPRSSFVPNPANYHPKRVSDLEEYWSFVEIAFWVFATFYLSIFIFVYVRNTIDLLARNKIVGTFRVTKSFRAFSYRILILNRWRIFFLRKQNLQYQRVNEGFFITIHRTLTFKLINYYIRTEKQFFNEQ